MSKQRVAKQLQDHIKLIYHKAIDADKKLKGLREQKKATFSQVFAAETVFRNHSNTFLPYVEEITIDLHSITTGTDEDYQKLLPRLVIKIELLFKMLNSLKNLKK